MGKQLEGSLQRQAGLGKRQKLLIEDQKIIGLDFLLFEDRKASPENILRPDRKNILPFGGQALSQLRLRTSLLRLVQHTARRGRDLADIIHVPLRLFLRNLRSRQLSPRCQVLGFRCQEMRAALLSFRKSTAQNPAPVSWRLKPAIAVTAEC
ncbi:MAG: hypothetical protein ACREP9_02405 [Candidatus Dormibacteraceae bacterium]